MNNRRNRGFYTSFEVRLSGLACACTFSADYIFLHYHSFFFKRILDRNLKVCFFFWSTCSQSHRCLWWRADPRGDKSQTANGQPYPEVDSQSIGLRRDRHELGSRSRCGGSWIPKILLFLLALRIMIIRRSGSFSFLPGASFMMKVLINLYGAQSKRKIWVLDKSVWNNIIYNIVQGDVTYQFFSIIYL